MVLSFDRPGGDSFYPLHDSIRLIELGLGSTTDPARLFDSIARIFAMRSAVLMYSKVSDLRRPRH
jgi:hypothetical protein